MSAADADRPPSPLPPRPLQPSEIRRCLRQMRADAPVDRTSVLRNGMTAGEFCVLYLRQTESSRRMKQQQRDGSGGGEDVDVNI